MTHFKLEFQDLESLLHLDTSDRIDMWTLHLAYSPSIQNKLNEFQTCCNLRPISGVGGQSQIN